MSVPNEEDGAVGLVADGSQKCLEYEPGEALARWQRR
jgi:hypothetical protein